MPVPARGCEGCSVAAPDLSGAALWPFLDALSGIGALPCGMAALCWHQATRSREAHINRHSMAHPLARRSLAAIAAGLLGTRPGPSKPGRRGRSRWSCPIRPAAVPPGGRPLAPKLAEDPRPARADREPGRGRRQHRRRISSRGRGRTATRCWPSPPPCSPSARMSCHCPTTQRRPSRPVTMTAVAHGVIAAHPGLPSATSRGWWPMRRRIRGGCASAPPAMARSPSCSGEIFAEATGIRLEHVPYRGSAPSLTDLLAGRRAVAVEPVAIPAIREGRLIGLATIGETRNPAAAGRADAGASLASPRRRRPALVRHRPRRPACRPRSCGGSPPPSRRRWRRRKWPRQPR